MKNKYKVFLNLDNITKDLYKNIFYIKITI